MLGFILQNMYNKLQIFKYKYENSYPVKHRLDKNNNLQYSVDGNLWTNIIIYNSPYEYNNQDPTLTYLNLKNENSYNAWCNTLSTLQKCHEWNKNALDSYVEAIKIYLKDK